MTTFGTVWTLRLQPFGNDEPGYFVGLGARRTDFNIRRHEHGMWTHWFADETDATAAARAVYRKHSKYDDVLLPKGKPVGQILVARDPNLRILATRCTNDVEWGRCLARFKPWTTSGNPQEQPRQQYNVHVEKQGDRWVVLGMEVDPW